MFLPQETIRRKRDGERLGQEELNAFAAGLADGSVSEGQAAAFAMAVYFRGMDTEERVALTLAMRDSGEVMDWTQLKLGGPVIDKHSTGGVGDAVSLVLGPLIAACGGYMPMISGRGLGHTGGTLDKLEAIPGYDVAPDQARFRQVVKKTGVAMIGQTGELAPADKRLYAVRDVTATVESIDLITASILSKKLAESLEALVMDVKIGNGAFMTSREEARALAESIVAVANGAGVKTSALLTDMNQPLAPCAGNAVEVREAVAVLKGERSGSRLEAVSLALGEELLVLGGLAADALAARALLETALASGKAAERFAKMVASLGGPRDFLKRCDEHLPVAPVIKAVPAERAGFVTGVDTRSLGMAVVELGGGRRRPEDPIDHSVGLTELAAPGDEIEAGREGRPLAVVHALSELEAAAAARRVREAYEIGATPSPAGRIVHERIRREDAVMEPSPAAPPVA